MTVRLSIILFVILSTATEPAWSATRPSGQWVRGSKVRNAATFQAAGVYWREPAAGTVQVRASTDGQSWTAWASAHGEAVDGGRISSGLFYFGEGYHFLEVEGVADPELLLIDAGLSSIAVPLSKRSEFTLPAAPPTLVSRAEWGCTPQTCPSQGPPIYTTVTHLIVHHTAGVNMAADWPSVVRSIWVLHVQGNGWNDIGYNYLVDPNGLLYEGRAGGDGVMGAHFSGVNSGTMGVALLGTYIDQMPPPEMRETLTRMLAWQAEKWRLDPAGEALHAASGLMINVVSGHRDAGLSPKATSTTECPGNTAYTLLPGLREDVRGRLPACVRVIGERNRCISTQGADTLVPLVVSEPGCAVPVDVSAAADWIRTDIIESFVRLRVVPNSGQRRSAVVSVGGQNIGITQASAAEQSLPCIGQRSVVDAADFDERPVVAGSLLTLFGENFTERTSVAVNGKPIPVLYAGTNQINVSLPGSTAIGTNFVTATTGGVTGPPTGFWVTEAVPAIFTNNQRHAIAINADDNHLNSSAQPVTAGRAVAVYLTGGGSVDNTASHNIVHPWSAMIGGRPAGTLFLRVALPITGVYQANVVVPSGLAAGDYPLSIKINGALSREAMISVGP